MEVFSKQHSDKHKEDDTALAITFLATAAILIWLCFFMWLFGMRAGIQNFLLGLF